MPVALDCRLGNDLPLDEFLERYLKLACKRKVRALVTPSGQRARGGFPSIKGPARVRWESLIEEDTFRVLEVSSLITKFQSHPAVLLLPAEPKPLHYTPDAIAQTRDGGFLIEVKADSFLLDVKALARMRQIVDLLSKHGGLRLTFILEEDVRTSGLQTELKELLRLRPIVGRYRATVDHSAWSPTGRCPATPELERRWKAAQAECDALLERALRRDLGDLVREPR